jgi:hypothetical protein
MWRYIAADYRASPDHRPFPDHHIGQDDTVRPDKDVLFYDNFSVVYGSSGSRVEVRDYRGSEADRAVIADGHVARVYFVNVYKLPNPDIASDDNSADPLQPRTQTESPRGYKSDPTREPGEQKWQPQRPLPRIAEMLEIGRVIKSSEHQLTTCAFKVVVALSGLQSAFAEHCREWKPPLKAPAFPTYSSPHSATNCDKCPWRKHARPSAMCRPVQLQENPP